MGAVIESFDLPPGYVIAGKYKILTRLGSGWEGEVFKIEEVRTGIERAAKMFCPHRNVGNRTARRYAKKLHKLRHCPVLIQYHTEDVFRYKSTPVTVLISEYVEGVLLSEFLKELPGGRLAAFEAMHMLYALTRGLEDVHLRNEYHGDLHTENIIVSRYGLEFDVKVMDFYHWGPTTAENRHADICDLILIFHESLGGARRYAKQPGAVKYVCSGLKRSIILRKFRTMTHLRKHLETMQW
jgi:serine/threonine protein kinase